MILFLDRVIQRLIRNYRKMIFRKKIKCSHNKFQLVGNTTLINTNITIGENVTLYPDVMIYGDGPITIGNNVCVGNGTILYASKDGGIIIGDNTIIAAQCYIIDMDHGFNMGQLISKQMNSVEKVIIGDDVWLAANVTVLKGSNIGNGAVIGAKSLVKGDIPENAVAVGIPAKVLKYRT